MIINLARRAHDHNWELDPITRSLLDTDFYKLLMLQFIWKNFPETQTSFTLLNRTSSVRLGEMLWTQELREQLEETRRLRFHKSELIWLAGNTFYGRRGIFEPAFLEWLEKDFRLSDFDLTAEDGQISLRFHGLWTETTMWEIYALSAIDELKTRASLKQLSEFELDILYARAKTRLWEKMERLRGVPRLSVSDFGTRRRHSFLWQEYVVKAMSDVLATSFAGSSNTYLAYKHDLEAIGTNAHELPMALAALANDDEELRSAQYRFLELWQQSYQGELLILLPDTFGTTQFLADAPDWVADWTGQRIDSKDPYVAGDEYIAWLERHGRDPRQKRLIAIGRAGCGADSRPARVLWRNARNGASPDEFQLRQRFSGCKAAGFPNAASASAPAGAHLLTNDFRNCNPHGNDGFDPVSLVCKLTEVEGRPAVKLSDNYSKALGDPKEVERYRRVFGVAGVADVPVLT